MTGALILHTAVNPDVFSPQRIAFGESNPLLRITKLTLLIVSAITIGSRLSQVKPLLRNLNRFFLLFLVLVPLSYLWSISPGDTISRYLGALTVTGVGIALCVREWNERQLQQAVRPVLALVLCGSLLFGVLAPDLAIGEVNFPSSWHGVTSSKNAFGQLASFGVIFWFHAWMSREAQPAKAITFLLVSLACLVLSRSSTALLATVFAMMFMLMLMRTPPAMKRFMPYIVAVFAGIVVTYALAVLRLVPGLEIILEPIAAITGKDLTFSDRSAIWELLKQQIQYHPWLGSGYGAFWIGPVPSSPSYIFQAMLYFYPGEAHNGYLEIVNDLGYVGLMCLVGYMVVYLRQALRVLRIDRPQGALFLGLFFEQAVNNLSEATWLDVNAAFIFGIMTISTVSMARTLLQHDLRRRVATPQVMSSTAPSARRWQTSR
jgi:exopolysaccharide production protein ExoQ